mgnify:CR=1 FL=1
MLDPHQQEALHPLLSQTDRTSVKFHRMQLSDLMAGGSVLRALNKMISSAISSVGRRYSADHPSPRLQCYRNSCGGASVGSVFVGSWRHRPKRRDVLMARHDICAENGFRKNMVDFQRGR